MTTPKEVLSKVTGIPILILIDYPESIEVDDILKAMQEYSDLQKPVYPSEEETANFKVVYKRLIELYKENPSFVAKVCDEILDQSGALLGRIRKELIKGE